MCSQERIGWWITGCLKPTPNWKQREDKKNISAKEAGKVPRLRRGERGHICAALCGVSLTNLGGFQCCRNSQSALQGWISITREHARHADSRVLPGTNNSESLEVGTQGNLGTHRSWDPLPPGFLPFVFAKRLGIQFYLCLRKLNTVLTHILSQPRGFQPWWGEHRYLTLRLTGPWSALLLSWDS